MPEDDSVKDSCSAETPVQQPHEVFMPYAVIPGSDKTMFQAWESDAR